MENYNQSAIALGNFDGVHIGHQKIVEKLLSVAKLQHLKPIIVTFFPHPSHILNPEQPLKLINSIEERVERLKKLGVDTVYVQEFNKVFSEISAFDFVNKTLIEELKIKHLIVGHDHSFGKNKEGNIEYLKQLGYQLGYETTQITPYYKDEKIVSSTLIRNLITEGNFEQVNQFLGYPFCLYGKVVQGNQLGRKIGYRTANIVLDYSNKIVPKRGVYVVKSKIDNECFYGMMNIGYRPTIDGKTQTIEIHFFNLNQDLYYQKIKVKVLHRLRDEQKFDNIEALKIQLDNDKLQAEKYIDLNF